jgi:hypothetical protein
MKPKVAVVMVHGHAAKWLQTVISSLKNTKNDHVEYDIFVAASWPDHPSLRALTETRLGDNITIYPCETLWVHGPQFSEKLGSHATGLDEILDRISFSGKYSPYGYMFTMETDCKVMKDGWLDWYLEWMKYPTKEEGMAGFFWEEGNNHYNVNPSATLYNMRMLREYHAQVKANTSETVYHPDGNSILDLVQHPPKIGVFSEVRGFKEPTELQLEYLTKGVPHAGWFEPGAWLFYRMLADKQYAWLELECEHIYKYWTRHHISPKGTYYGGMSDPYLIHYWGGTRAWDELKHEITDPFVKECADPWKQREHEIWIATVPVKDREIMKEIYEEMGI